MEYLFNLYIEKCDKMKTLIGGSMGQYFKYKIDKVKFNNIKEHNFFEVYGWCYAQNVELISYEVKVNNKDVLFEID